MSGVPDLIGTADVKTHLEITTTSRDSLISALVTAASNAITQRYQREFIQPSGGTATRTFGVRDWLVDLAPYDLRGATTVTLHPEESPQVLSANSDYLLLPQGGARLGGSYLQMRLSTRLTMNSTIAREFGQPRLQIAGTWGIWSGTASVDDSVKRACIVTVASWMDRATAEYASFSSDDGRQLVPDRFATYSIPNAAHYLMAPWGRVGTP